MAKTATKPKRSTGRPKAVIDWNQVGKLCEAGASGVGIAATIGVDEGTLRKRCEADNNCSFSEFSQQKRAKGDELLRSKQFQVAMAGDKTMLIWLGKQRLNQSDKSESKTEHSGEVHHDLSKLSMDELIKLKEINQKIAT